VFKMPIRLFIPLMRPSKISLTVFRLLPLESRAQDWNYVEHTFRQHIKGQQEKEEGLFWPETVLRCNA